MTDSAPMIDTHCHLNFDRYDEDRDAVIERATAAGVNRVIIPAVDRKSIEQITPLIEKHDNLFMAVGVHPNSTDEFSDDLLAELRQLADRERVIAIGEIGLDYYWKKVPRDRQIKAFEAQLALAADLELPVIIHNRESGEDVIAILEQWAGSLPDSLRDRPGVLHSFSAPQAIADRAITAGFYLGFTGPITFKNADSLRRIAADVPLERILVETDGPFLTPHPYRGKRNEPAYIPYIVERLANLKQITKDAMAHATTENAVRLFQLPE